MSMGGSNGMPRHLRNAILFLVLLIPSAQFAWRNRDMPQFAYLHDDGVLFVSAKSLADGNGYRIPSLPENSFQTKFPPLYPAVLAAIWKLNPSFPANLSLATALCWAAMALCLALSWKLFQGYGLSSGRAWLVAALLGLNPYFILFGCMLFAEMWFTCLVLVSLLLARKETAWAAFGAGVAAAAAYLSRTAGIALLVSIPVLWLWRREWRRALAFASPLLAAMAVWTLWTRAHLPRTTDLTVLYYADYMGFRAPNFGLDNITVILWKNLDRILYSIGGLILPEVTDMLPVKILTQVLGVAMISGVIRMARRGMAVDYALFSLASSGILMMWHYPANERLVLPMAPLLVAGFITEAGHFWAMLRLALRQGDTGQRVVGAGFGLVATSLIAVAFGLQVYMTFVFLHKSTELQRARLADRRAAYQWMAKNLPSSATILSYDDPLVYLYSGLRGNYMPLMPRWWYADDHASMVRAYADIASYCRRRGLGYFYFTTEDLSRETGEEDRQAIVKSVQENRELEPLFQAGIGTVYRVRPNTQSGISPRDFPALHP
jgi:hypothetical protein